MLWWNKKLTQIFWMLFFIIFAIGLEGCRSVTVTSSSYRAQKNNKNVWNQKNSRIRKYVKHYSAKSNRTVELTLKRAQPYLPYIKKELKKRKLPLQLAYLPMLESSFNPKAKSRTGALGMWQFTEATAKDYGLKVGWFKDDRLNWRKSTKAAVLYLSRLGKKFNYNWELALAAYNGGPGYISRSMKKQRTWSFWKLKLRQEPQEYVPRFIAMLQVAHRKHARLYKLRADLLNSSLQPLVMIPPAIPLDADS